LKQAEGEGGSDDQVAAQGNDDEMQEGEVRRRQAMAGARGRAAIVAINIMT
jgi:hypothetical protein